MKKINRLVFCLIAGCISMVSFAQSESQTKEINKIKLDPGYVFAESTMENADEARETVCLTLSNFMNEYLEESGESRRVAAAELGAIKYINAKRGNATYVFGYIPVSAFSSAAPAPVENTVAEEPVAVETEPVVEPSSPVAPQQMAESEDTYAAPAPQPAPAVEDDYAYAEVSPEQQAMGSAALGMLFGNVFDQPSSSQKKISCQANPSDSGQLTDMISELLESADARKAAYLLNVYKTTGKIRGFGALPTCRDAAGSHWLIIDATGSIVALLGPAADDNRHNYVSGGVDHLASYGGKYAVWFTPRAR